MKRYLSRGYDVLEFVWSKKQGNQKQNKTQSQYLCVSVIILDRHIFHLDFKDALRAV